MKMRLILMLILVLPISLSQAQDEPNTLDAFRGVLALTPDVPLIQQYGVSYANYDAIVAAREGAAQITSWENYNRLDESDDETENLSAQLWSSAMFGIASGPADYMQTAFGVGRDGEMLAAVGFDLFDVQAGIEYGAPPSDVTIITGDFNVEAIVSVYEANGYTTEEHDDFLLLCGPEGCENANTMNLEERNMANPFGGKLGRQQPIILYNNYIISSPDYSRIQAYVSLLSNDNYFSMDESASIQAVLEVLGDYGILIQANIYHPIMFSFGDPISVIFADPSMTAEERQALLEEAEEKYIELPRYEQVIIADMANGDEQHAITALVYSDEETAQTAAVAVHERMSTYMSLLFKESLLDTFERRNATLDTPWVYTSENGKYVVVIDVHGPMPPPERLSIEDGGLGRPIQSSMVYKLFVNMVISQDTGWLVIGMQ